MFDFSKCCFDVSLCRTRCEFGIAIMLKIQENVVLQSGRNGLRENRRTCKPSFEALYGLLYVLQVISRTLQLFRQPCELSSDLAACVCITIFYY